MRGLSGRPAAAILVLSGVIYLVLLASALIWFHLSPELVLILTLGGIGIPFLCLRPLVGVHLFLATLYIENSLSRDTFVMKAIGLAALASWLLNVAVRRNLRLNLGPLIFAMLLLVVWCGVSAVFANDAQIALLRTFSLAQLAVAALMFSSVLDTVQKVRTIYAAIVGWTCVTAVVALAMYYLGMTRVAQGFMLNRNALAMHIIVGIICAYVLYQAAQTPVVKAICLATFPVFFLGVALTLSRTGIVMLVAALLLVWIRMAREKRFFVIGSTLAVLCLVSFLLPETFWKRADSILPAIRDQADTFGLRIKIWKVGAEMVRDHPITGVGAGNFLGEFSRYARGRFLWRHLSPHNAFVGMAAETGLVGLGLLILILLFGLTTARSAIRAGGLAGDLNVRFFGIVAEVAILAQIVGCFTGDGESQKILWIMFGVALTLQRVGQEALARHPTSSSPLRKESATVDAPAWGLVR